MCLYKMQNLNVYFIVNFLYMLVVKDGLVGYLGS